MPSASCAKEQLKESHLRYSEQADVGPVTRFAPLSAVNWTLRLCQISRLSASCREAEDRKGRVLGPG